MIEARGIALATRFVPPIHAVRLPTLLHHDTASHVLVLRDLGRLPSLTQILSAVGGNHTLLSPSSPDQKVVPTDRVSPNTVTYFTSIGRKIGEYFALLHAPRTRDTILTSPGKDLAYLENPSMKNVVLELAIRPVRQLGEFPGLFTSQEADEFYQLIETDFLRSPTPEELSFVLGDCWPAAILVQPDFDHPDPLVGVIDWEFASFARGVHGDISQLLAHFQLFRFAGENLDSDVYVMYIDAMVTALVSAYREESQRQGAEWLANGPGRHDPPAASSLRATILRSAFLAHAAEITNAVFWKAWVCRDSSCPVVEHTTANQAECRLVQRMVESAAWYLRAAKRDNLHFCEPEHWQEICHKAALSNAMYLLKLI